VNFSALRDRVAADTVRLAPTLLYSGAVGWGARRRLPRRLRARVYSAFARAVGARLDEVELPLEDYPSFASFFARRLRPGAREIATGQGVLISPCDGTVAAVGTTERGKLIQAKGREYDLATLLCDDQLAAMLEGGHYLTIYLSPRDYHRVHAPSGVEVLGYDYVPGALFPVNPYFSQRVDNLFAINERMVLALAGDMGAMALVMVGASGVGNVTLCHPHVEAREFRRAGALRRVRLHEPVSIARGAELGAFHLGSTVILVFEPGGVELAELSSGQALCFGESIGRVVSRSN
jgi:phosphatidylserine decarboxylase